MRMREHAEKISYFFIAFAIALLAHSFFGRFRTAFLNELLYLFVGLSLLASNIPRVLDIPLHYVYPLKCVEYFTFAVSVICFVLLCIRHLI